MAAWRQETYKQNCIHHFLGRELSADNPWVMSKFVGQLTQPTIDRSEVRVAPNGKLLLPLLHSSSSRILGFQELDVSHVMGKKRFLMNASNKFLGSYSVIRPMFRQGETLPTLICEGFSTALSLAEVWSGEIRVAMSAQNIRAVRAQIHSRVILAADNDQWRPAVGNTGIFRAKEALQENDCLLVPHFSDASKRVKPTDFNDLFRLEGKECVAQQVTRAMEWQRLIG